MMARNTGSWRVVLAVAATALVAAPTVGQQASYYVLDGFGGVHAGGDAPAITPATPYFGFDIARDLAYVAVGRRIGTVDVVGDGLLVLDGFGGIHAGGALPRSMATPTTPYFGFDVARAITARNVPPRISGREEPDDLEILTNSFVPVATTTIRAPDDGFLLVMTTVSVRCTLGEPVIVAVGQGLDSTSATSALQWSRLEDCPDTEGLSLVKSYPVSPGAHFVHLLARRGSFVSTQTYVRSRSIQVLFVDQDAMGGS